MAGYTPGPWEAIPLEWHSDPIGEKSGIQVVVAGKVDEYGYPIVICDNQPYYPQEVDPANARLIAAAPELLEALQNARALWAFRSTDDVQRAWLDQVDAAIAKVTGEAA